MDSYDLACNGFRHIESNFNVKVSLAMLRYVGNWPPRGRYRSLYMLYTLVSITLVPAIYIFVQAAYLIDVWGDVDKMIAVSFLLMTNTCHIYKMAAIVLRQKRIQALLDVTTSEIFSDANVRYERITTWYTWSGILHHVAYQSIGVLAVAGWAYAAIAELAFGETEELSLPVDSWYPYNTDESPLFEITCAHQIVAIFILSFHNIAMDTLATNLITVACCQLDILKRDIGAIGSDDEDDEKSITCQEEACRRLNYCIEHNKVIMNFVTEIQDIFGVAIICNCIANCVIICLTAFHISQMNDNDPAEIVGTTMYVGAMTYQIFIFCWHGNELALQSESVSLAAYTGNWWKFSERYKSTLRILMINSYRPMIIKVGGIMTISLDTFTSILRMSYSLFTVLQSARTD